MSYLNLFVPNVEDIPDNVSTLLTNYVLAPCPALSGALIVREGDRIGPLSCMRDDALWSGFVREDAGSFPLALRQRVWIKRDKKTVYALHSIEDKFVIDFLRGAFIGEIERAVMETIGDINDATDRYPERYKTRVGDSFMWSAEPEENKDFWNASARTTLVLDPARAAIVITRHDLLPRVAEACAGIVAGVRLSPLPL
jgi:hypothetical protein